jgi:hypothetical protein
MDYKLREIAIKAAFRGAKRVLPINSYAKRSVTSSAPINAQAATSEEKNKNGTSFRSGNTLGPDRRDFCGRNLARIANHSALRENLMSQSAREIFAL